jgi:hypothetical protein
MYYILHPPKETRKHQAAKRWQLVDLNGTTACRSATGEQQSAERQNAELVTFTRISVRKYSSFRFPVNFYDES